MSSVANLRRIWWLDPAFAFAAVVVPTILIAWWQSDAAFGLYKTPKYIELWHVLLAGAAVAAFTIGTRLALATHHNPRQPPADADRILRRWFYFLLVCTAFGYTVWTLVAVKRGFTLGMMQELLTTDNPVLGEHVKQNIFDTVPGVTTFTQFGVPAMLIGTWLYFNGMRGALFPMVVLVFVAVVRSILCSERTAILELLFPIGLLALRLKAFNRPLPAWGRTAIRMAPLIGPVVLVLFFGSFEYFRSWRYYRNEFKSYSEFTVWRLAGYYTTAHNNGAMALETDQVRPLPYYTLRPFWLFPGIINSSIGYRQLTGRDIEEDHVAMLKRYGNFELNNEGGLFQPTVDFGVAGSLIFWLGYGFLAGRLYLGFQAGSIAGLTYYPLIYFSLLEVPLVLFLCYSRMFPPFVALAAVAWTVRHRTSAQSQPLPQFGSLAEAK